MLLIVFDVLLIVFQIMREYGSKKREEEYLEYQNAMNSTVHAYRAIYYIDVKKKLCSTVYPAGPGGKPRRCGYDEEVADGFSRGVVDEAYCDQVFDFLDLEHIVSRLAGKDYIELKFKRRRFDLNTRKIEGDEYEWCSIAVTVAERRDGELTAITMAIRTIDEVIRREEEQKQMLELAAARAEAASHAKSDFLSRMSHDIRTPMNAILGMTAVALMHIDEKSRVVDALDKINVSGRHLLGLINEVLDMSRIESGRVSLTEECFNLSDTMERD